MLLPIKWHIIYIFMTNICEVVISIGLCVTEDFSLSPVGLNSSLECIDLFDYCIFNFEQFLYSLEEISIVNYHHNELSERN